MENITCIMKKQRDFYAMKGAEPSEIRETEESLGVSFAEDYREYVGAFGAASFAGHELTGVCKSPRLNVAAVTAEERKTNDVPAGWYVLEQANIDGIVLWQDKEGSVYQTMPSSAPKKICGSLAEYIALMA